MAHPTIRYQTRNTEVRATYLMLMRYIIRDFSVIGKRKYLRLAYTQWRSLDNMRT